MKVLFIASGRQGGVNPIVKNQGESLRRAGVELEYFVVNGRGWKSYVKSIKPLRKKVREGGCDVIHAHYSWTAYLASIATIGLKVPMVVSLMGNDILDHWWYPGLARMVAKMKPWKAVIVKSQEMKERVGMPYANVVPNGVNLDKFHPMDKEECQAILGWKINTDKPLAAINIDKIDLGNQKNDKKNNEGLSDTCSISTETAPQSACMQASRQPDDPFRSIDSVAQTLSDNPSSKIQKIISSDTANTGRVLHVLFPARKEDTRKNWPLAYSAVETLNKRISNLGLQISNFKEIELHQMNGVPNDKTPIMYNAADAVMLPSFYEGSANAVKEAMACNAPLVTTDMGDCWERLNGLEGCFIVPSEELKVKSEELKGDWRLTIEDCRLKNEKWELYVHEMAEALEKAMKHGKTKGRERLLADGIADYQIAQRLISIYQDVIKKEGKKQ